MKILKICFSWYKVNSFTNSNILIVFKSNIDLPTIKKYLNFCRIGCFDEKLMGFAGALNINRINYMLGNTVTNRFSCNPTTSNRYFTESLTLPNVHH